MGWEHNLARITLVTTRISSVTTRRSESCSRAGVHRNLLGALGGLKAAAGLVCTPICLGPRRGLRAAAGLVCTPTCLGLWKLGAELA